MGRENNFLIKTVKGTRRQIIFYDPDVFDEKVTLSATLLLTPYSYDLTKNTETVPNTEVGLYDITPDTPNTVALAQHGVTHYNTILDEEPNLPTPTPLEELAVRVHPKPKSTKILGAKEVERNSQYTYNIDRYYDPNNEYRYDWDFMEGYGSMASFEGTNRSTKSVKVNFGSADAKVVLKCTITNAAGCYRVIYKNIYIGIVSRDLLVVRNTYF